MPPISVSHLLLCPPTTPSCSHFIVFSLSLISADVSADEVAAFLASHLITGPDFTSLIHPGSLQPFSPLSSLSPLCIILSIIVSSSFLFFIFFTRLQSASVSISMGSEQQGRGKTRLGHHSTLAFPCISPSMAAAVHREPGTKWSIYWLNEKIAFFDC